MIRRFDCKGFGQIEPSQVWFTRTGMVESQCYLDEEKFAASFPMTPAEAEDGKIYAENGAFLMVDKANKTAKVKVEIIFTGVIETIMIEVNVGR